MPPGAGHGAMRRSTGAAAFCPCATETTGPASSQHSMLGRKRRLVRAIGPSRAASASCLARRCWPPRLQGRLKSGTVPDSRSFGGPSSRHMAEAGNTMLDDKDDHAGLSRRRFMHATAARRRRAAGGGQARRFERPGCSLACQDVAARAGDAAGPTGSGRNWRSIRARPCSMRCASTSASPARRRAVAMASAAPAPCTSTGKSVNSCLTPSRWRRRAMRSPPSRGWRHLAVTCIRCSRPSSTTMRSSAATAPRARSCRASPASRVATAGSEDSIREFMSGNLCRCAAYPNIVAAIVVAKSKMGA